MKEGELKHRKVILESHKRTEISFHGSLTDLQQHNSSCLSMESSIHEKETNADSHL